MSRETEKAAHAEIGMPLADAILGVASTLHGASDALAYRAAAEDDDMLALLSDVLNDQSDVLRTLIR